MMKKPGAGRKPRLPPKIALPRLPILRRKPPAPVSADPPESEIPAQGTLFPITGDGNPLDPISAAGKPLAGVAREILFGPEFKSRRARTGTPEFQHRKQPPVVDGD